MTTRELGLREAREQLGPIANRANLAGEITYLTRNGKRIAAIVPLDRIKETAVTEPTHYTVTIDADTARWLTATSGTDRLGGDTGRRYFLVDLGDGRVAIPTSSLEDLMERDEADDGKVTHNSGTFTMWIEGLDYQLTPYGA
jgi:antitoxin (DNA-binding transcriptional repressor) of toxin-antitoxin stability system